MTMNITIEVSPRVLEQIDKMLVRREQKLARLAGELEETRDAINQIWRIRNSVEPTEVTDYEQYQTAFIESAKRRKPSSNGERAIG